MRDDWRAVRQPSEKKIDNISTEKWTARRRDGERVVEWATIDPIASAMDVDFWMRERRLRDGGYRWQRRGDWDWGSWSEEEEKWPDANFAAVHIHKTIRYPIVIVVDYQYIRCRRETPLSMARRDSHDYRIPPSWPNIFGHTDTLLYYSVLSFRLIDKSSRFWWLLPSSCLVDFLWYWLRMPTYTYKSPPRHSWEKFRQVPAVATPILWIKRKFIMWRGDRI